MIQYETIFKGIKKCGPCRQVVFVDRWSLKQVWLYIAEQYVPVLSAYSLSPHEVQDVDPAGA